MMDLREIGKEQKGRDSGHGVDTLGIGGRESVESVWACKRSDVFLL